MITFVERRPGRLKVLPATTLTAAANRDHALLAVKFAHIGDRKMAWLVVRPSERRNPHWSADHYSGRAGFAHDDVTRKRQRVRARRARWQSR